MRSSVIYYFRRIDPQRIRIDREFKKVRLVELNRHRPEIGGVCHLISSLERDWLKLFLRRLV